MGTDQELQAPLLTFSASFPRLAHHYYPQEQVQFVSTFLKEFISGSHSGPQDPSVGCTPVPAAVLACVIVHEMGLPAYSQVLGFVGKSLILSCHFISIVLLLAKPGCLQRHPQMHGDVN